MIVLCRHASTEANATGRFLSRSDPPLSGVGRIQCENLREELASYDFDRIFSSPARRCLETIAIAIPNAVFEVRAELREVDFGSWEGQTLEEVRSREPERVELRMRSPVHFRPDGGESFADVAARLADFAHDIGSSRERTLIVAHRGTLAVLERLLRGLDLADRSVKPVETAELRVVE
jgi:probable phosphoglycerate mutase